MTAHHLPPDITQYLGPAFTPVVEILWTVVWLPIWLVVECVFMAANLNAFQQAAGALVLGVATIVSAVLLFLLAVAGIFVLGFLATCLTVFVAAWYKERAEG